MSLSVSRGPALGRALALTQQVHHWGHANSWLLSLSQHLTVLGTVRSATFTEPGSCQALCWGSIYSRLPHMEVGATVFILEVIKPRLAQPTVHVADIFKFFGFFFYSL